MSHCEIAKVQASTCLSSFAGAAQHIAAHSPPEAAPVKKRN